MVEELVMVTPSAACRDAAATREAAVGTSANGAGATEDIEYNTVTATTCVAERPTATACGHGLLGLYGLWGGLRLRLVGNRDNRRQGNRPSCAAAIMV